MSFWTELEKPSHLSLRAEKSVTRRRRGRGGEAVYDLLLIEAESDARVRLLVLAKPRLVPAQVRAVKADLAEVIDEIERSESDRNVAAPRIYPGLRTESADENLFRECERERVALFDGNSRMLISAGGIYVRVERPTRHAVAAPRKNLFVGKSLRAIRVLLCWQTSDFSVRDLAAAADIGFGSAQSVLRALEENGYVRRRSAKSGFNLVNYPGLLRAWIDSRGGDAGESAYYCPSTETSHLRAAFERLAEKGIDAAFTLAAGVEASRRFVAGTPVGLYVSHDIETVAGVFGLERSRPHNFLVRVPSPVNASRFGGVFYALEAGDVGQVVCRPQLIHDLVQLGGRSREEGERLFEELIKQNAEVVSNVPRRQEV